MDVSAQDTTAAVVLATSPDVRQVRDTGVAQRRPHHQMHQPSLALDMSLVFDTRDVLVEQVLELPGAVDESHTSSSKVMAYAAEYEDVSIDQYDALLGQEVLQQQVLELTDGVVESTTSSSQELTYAIECDDVSDEVEDDENQFDALLGRDGGVATASVETGGDESHKLRASGGVETTGVETGGVDAASGETRRGRWNQARVCCFR